LLERRVARIIDGYMPLVAEEIGASAVAAGSWRSHTGVQNGDDARSEIVLEFHASARNRSRSATTANRHSSAGSGFR
jgi:hypothetical protein